MKITLSKDKKFLVDALFKTKTKKNLTLLVEDLFTDEETLDLAQRLKIADCILQDKTYEEIEKLIPVSSSTISKIGQVIKFGKSGFKIALTKTKKSK